MGRACTVFKQQESNFLEPLGHCQLQRRAAIVIVHIDVCILFDQVTGTFGQTASCCFGESCTNAPEPRQSSCKVDPKFLLSFVLGLLDDSPFGLLCLVLWMCLLDTCGLLAKGGGYRA